MIVGGKSQRKNRINEIQITLLTITLAVLIIWPAVLNGGPFWFPDTSTYIRGADAAFYTITGQETAWSDKISTVMEPDTKQRPGSATNPSLVDGQAEKIVLTGRSIYYGAIVFLPMQLVGPWGAVLVQVLITAFVIIFSTLIVMRASYFAIRKTSTYGLRALSPYIALGIIALFTPLAYYTNMLMPDIYAGLFCLVLAVSILFWREMSHFERAVGVALACAFATFHTTIMLLAIVVSGVAIVFANAKNARIRAALLGVAVVSSAVIANILFTTSVTKFAGQKPMNPPFLTARITAAGPGTDYLARYCRSESPPFAMCSHRDKLPLDSDDFLWGEEENRSLFKILPVAEQRLIASEDKRFYLAVFMDDPVKVASLAVINGAEVLSRFGLENFNYPMAAGTTAPNKYPQSIWDDISKSRAAQQTMPVEMVQTSTLILTLVSLAVFAFILVQSRREAILVPPKVARFALLICAAVFANALICGALSKPHSRYQARIIWLLPLAAALTSASIRRRQGPNSTDPRVHLLEAQRILGTVQ